MTNQESTTKDFEYTRYSALIELWYHHNTMQLQWPAVIVGAALLILSTVIPSRLTKVLAVSSWGRDPDLVLTVGIPMSLIGFGLFILLYTMRRARAIMVNLENQIDEIDKLANVEKSFKQINHPKGISATRLMWNYLLVVFAVPITGFGLTFSLGLKRTVVCLLVIILTLSAWRGFTYLQRKLLLRGPRV